MAPFKLNQSVWIRSMGVKGKIVEQRGADRFIVQVERLTVECQLSDLSADKPKGVKAKKFPVIRKHHPALKPVSSSKSLMTQLRSIDLHGLTVEEAVARVDKRVNDAIIADIDRLEIVHGVGTGALLKAVHQYLASIPVVKRYRLDELNPGVTYVYFE